MPGLTFWMTQAPDPAACRERFTAAQTLMLHVPDNTAVVDVEEPGFLLGHVGYPGYPVRLSSTGELRIAVEGRVYTKDARTVDLELAGIAERVLLGSEDPRTLLARWIRDAEGEYLVVLAAPKRREAVIFCDLLGCLPTYYHEAQDGFLLAREAKFVQRLKAAPGFDRVAWAQMMWTGHVLGRRTLYEGVGFAPAAGMFRVRPRAAGVHVEQASLYVMNYDEKDQSGLSLEGYATGMRERLVAVCRDWGSQPGVSTNVVSLSGGQDSRSVLGAMVRAGVPVVARTFVDAEGTATADAKTAKQIADALKVPWAAITVPAADEAQERLLTWMKDGANYVRMAFILNFLKEVAKQCGRNAVYMTGEGGNHVYADLREGEETGSVSALAQRMLRWFERMPAGQAEKVMRLEPGTLAAELRAILSEFPETALEQKVTHYVIYERDRHWTFEAQDRNRFFMWHASPLYAFRFFDYAMRIPDGLKRGYRLCAAVQRQLSPQVAQIPDAWMRSVAGDLRFRVKLRGRAFARNLPRPLRNLVRRMWGLPEGRFAVAPGIRAVFQEELRLPDGLAGLVDAQELTRFLDNCNEAQFCNFWTMVRLVRMWRERTQAAQAV